jgi:hypothetical protein
VGDFLQFLDKLSTLPPSVLSQPLATNGMLIDLEQRGDVAKIAGDAPGGPLLKVEDSLPRHADV